MKSRKSLFFRGVSCIFTAVLVSSLLTSCFDLGNYGGEEYGDYEGYYSAFGDVSAYYGAEKNTYTMRHSLFTVSTVGNLDWNTEEGDEPVEPAAYHYIALPFADGATVKSFSLFLRPSKLWYPEEEEEQADKKGEEKNESLACTVSVTAFILGDESEIPEKPWKRGEPAFKEIADESAPGGIRKEPIDYDDPDPDSAVARLTFDAAPGEWCSFTADAFVGAQGTVSAISVPSGHLLLIRIDNNTAYGEQYPSVEFAFTNLLVCRAD